jgi:hypothetical protein
MPTKKQAQPAESSERSTMPSHYAYHVRETEGDKSFWTRVGSAWAHRDGKGFTIQLDAVPIDGRVTLRRPEEKNPAQSGGRSAHPAPV